MERALRESREDLDRAQAVARTGSWRLDVNRNELAWSTETFRMFGISPETPLISESFLAAVHPGDKSTSTAAGSLLSPAHPTTSRTAPRGADQTAHERGGRSLEEPSCPCACDRSADRGDAPDEFIDRFQERILALSVSQDLLVRNKWKGVLDKLARSQLAHFNELIGARIRISGPPLLVSASAAQTLSMALHELATNGGKYGALSTDVGRVEVAWGVEHGDGPGETFLMSWRESGGPIVKAPAHNGLARPWTPSRSAGGSPPLETGRARD